MKDLHTFKHGLLDSSGLHNLLKIQNPDIVEIGCNDGTDTVRFLNKYPKASSIICFEPDPRAIAKFKQHKFPPEVRLHETALGNHVGEVTFYQSSGTPDGKRLDWDMSGSIKKPTGHFEYSPWCKFDNKLTVPLHTLDYIIREYHSDLDIIDLIWMDVQGAEQDVIEGAENTLELTRFVYAEFSHWKRPLYEGQMDLEQTINMLGQGWEPLAVYENCNVLLKNKEI